MPLTKEDLAEAKRMLAKLMLASDIYHISYGEINPNVKIQMVSEIECMLTPSIFPSGEDVCELTRTAVPIVLDKGSDELWEDSLPHIILAWFNKLNYLARLKQANSKQRKIIKLLKSRYKDIARGNVVKMNTAQIVRRLRKLVSDAEWPSTMPRED
jgi:hypothetical protein